MDFTNNIKEEFPSFPIPSRPSSERCTPNKDNPEMTFNEKAENGAQAKITMDIETLETPKSKVKNSLRIPFTTPNKKDLNSLIASAMINPELDII